MQRSPEPELMAEAQQALEYAQADFSEPNGAFVERLLARWQPQGKVVDLGCGPADIPVRLAQRCSEVLIDAVDGSRAMLDWGQQAIDAAGVTTVTLHCAQLQQLQLSGRYSAVLSNSLLHHLHEPALLWRCVKQLAAPGAWVLVMDLMRPPSPEAAAALVEQHAADAPPILKKDFLASLHAAFSVQEVREQLREAGLSQLTVEPVSDRHLVVEGRL